MPSIVYRSFLLFVLLFTAGCTPSYMHFEYRLDEQARYIQGVPFFPQEENYCGPASLAGVLGYWGFNVSQEEVAREIYTPKVKGTITVDMANYARNKGFDAVSYGGDLGKLKAEIERGHPLILFLHMGNPMVPRRHYIVVVGYDESKKAIIANSAREKDILIPYEDLLKDWKRTGYWTLVITPNQTNRQ